MVGAAEEEENVDENLGFEAAVPGGGRGGREGCDELTPGGPGYDMMNFDAPPKKDRTVSGGDVIESRTCESSQENQEEPLISPPHRCVGSAAAATRRSYEIGDASVDFRQPWSEIWRRRQHRWQGWHAGSA